MFRRARALLSAGRDLRRAARQHSSFVLSLPAVSLPEAEGAAWLVDGRPVSVRIDSAGLPALERAAAAARGVREMRLDLELNVPSHSRGSTPPVLATLAGQTVGHIDDRTEVARWALRADVTLDGGVFAACGTLRRAPGERPPYTLEIALPAPGR